MCEFGHRSQLAASGASCLETGVVLLCATLLELCPCLCALTVPGLSILVVFEARTWGYLLKGFLVDLNAQVAQAGGGS